LANIAYQGYAGGVDVEELRQVGSMATDGLLPVCTFLLDLEPSASLARLGRELDRVESRGPAYRQRLRDGFLQEAAKMGGSVHVIAADRLVEDVQADIRQIAEKALSAG
jgi:dTMP kinase